MPKRSRPPYRISFVSLIMGCWVLGAPSAAALAAPEEAAAHKGASTELPICEKEPPARKKRSSGLGGLLGAVQNSGAGRMLGSGLLGGGSKGSIAGAVLGTAVEAAAGASQAAAEAQAPQPAAGPETKTKQDCRPAWTQNLSEGP